jgi:hypothetical protein
MPLQELADMVGRFARVTGRVRARTADEATQKIEQHLAVALNPLQQLRLTAFHSGSPVAFTRQAVEQFMAKLWGRQAHRKAVYTLSSAAAGL